VPALPRQPRPSVPLQSRADHPQAPQGSPAPITRASEPRPGRVPRRSPASAAGITRTDHQGLTTAALGRVAAPDL
jgi:hypothetical protein